MSQTALFLWTCCGAETGPISLPFKFGMSGDFSNYLPLSGIHLAAGTDVALGNWAGHAATFIHMDDAYNPAIATTNALTMEKQGVLLFMDCIGLGTANALSGILGPKKIPFMTALTGSRTIHDPLMFFREAVNIRSSYSEEVELMLNVTKIVVLIQFPVMFVNFVQKPQAFLFIETYSLAARFFVLFFLMELHLDF